MIIFGIFMLCLWIFCNCYHQRTEKYYFVLLLHALVPLFVTCMAWESITDALDVTKKALLGMFFVVTVILYVIVYNLIGASNLLGLYRDLPNALMKKYETVKGRIATSGYEVGKISYRYLVINHIMFKDYYYDIKEIKPDVVYEVTYLPHSKYFIAITPR